jgi:hypothetical protein
VPLIGRKKFWGYSSGSFTRFFFHNFGKWTYVSILSLYDGKISQGTVYVFLVHEVTAYTFTKCRHAATSSPRDICRQTCRTVNIVTDHASRSLRSATIRRIRRMSSKILSGNKHNGPLRRSREKIGDKVKEREFGFEGRMALCATSSTFCEVAREREVQPKRHHNRISAFLCIPGPGHHEKSNSGDVDFFRFWTWPYMGGRLFRLSGGIKNPKRIVEFLENGSTVLDGLSCERSRNST